MWKLMIGASMLALSAACVNTGNIETEPVEAASQYQSNLGALVDATAMLQLDVKVGDSVKIGNVTLPILGKLKTKPTNDIMRSINY